MHYRTDLHRKSSKTAKKTMNKRGKKTLKCAQGLQKQKYTQDLAVWTLLVALNNRTRLKKIANQINKSTFIGFKSQKSSAGESHGYCKRNKAKLALSLKNNGRFQMCFFSDCTAKTYICPFPEFHSIRTWHIGTFLYHLSDHRCEYIPPMSVLDMSQQKKEMS